MEWTDITSYSRDGKRTPTWWKIKLGTFDLKVGNKHIHYSEDNARWFMIFDQGREILGAKIDMTEEQAKEKALLIVADRLEQAVKAIDRKLGVG